MFSFIAAQFVGLVAHRDTALSDLKPTQLRIDLWLSHCYTYCDPAESVHSKKETKEVPIASRGMRKRNVS